MANFPNQLLTNVGWDALSEAMAGQRLLFVRMAAGDGEVASDDALLEMTDLANHVMDVPITGYRALGDGKIIVTGTLRSVDVNEGFYLREVGIFCTLTPEDGAQSAEILYSINNARDQGDYIPGRDEQTVVIQAIEVQVLISRAENVEVIVVIGEAGIDGENLGTDGSAIFAGRHANMMQFKRLVSRPGFLPLELTETEETVGFAIGAFSEPDAGTGPVPGPGEPDPSIPVIGLMPTGAVLPFAAQRIPSGWLRCVGDAVSRATYARLFRVIGTAFGVGDGSTTFNLPNLARRFPVGAGVGWGLWAETGGAETVILTHEQMPVHAHLVTVNAHSHVVAINAHNHGDPGHVHWSPDPTHAHNVNFQNWPAAAGGQGVLLGSGPHVGVPSLAAPTGIGATDLRAAGLHAAPNPGGWTDSPAGAGITDNRGSSHAFDNMPPYLGLNYIIKD